MNIGFSMTIDPQGAELRLLGRTAMRGLLATHVGTDLFVAVVGRLQYRDELSVRLKISSETPLDDAEFAARVYARWGAEGLTRLEGSFSLVLFDRPRQRLFALRDPMGGYPLYWAESQGRFGASTSLNELRARFESAGIDADFMADYLALPSSGQNEPTTPRTPFRGISRLMAGNLLTYNAATGKTEVRKYWDWLDRLEDPETADLEQLAAGYADRLRAAVREGLRGNVAAHLSGGVDSTSVCLLALEEVERGRFAGPLHAISLVYSQMRVLSRERSLIEELGQSRHGLQAHVIEADALLNFGAYADPPEHDEPWPWLSSVEIESARLSAALDAGADTVLTGHGADEMAEIGPCQGTDLLRQGTMIRPWSIGSQAARTEKWILSPFNLLPLALREGAGSWARGGYTDWSSMSETSVPPWVRPEFARKFQLRARMLQHTRETFHACQPVALSIARSRILNRSGDLGRWHLYAPHGIHLCHPFLDPRLLRYCLGIHSRIPPPPRGQPKPLLAKAMQRVLPEKFRTRPKAGFFNEPYFRGMARHLGELEALVRSAPSEFEFLDREMLVNCLRQTALGIGNARIQVDRVNLTLSLLKWLALQSSPQPEPREMEVESVPIRRRSDLDSGMASTGELSDRAGSR
jgi:asparagine synthase (glutamine-hydrolysing)